MRRLALVTLCAVGCAHTHPRSSTPIDAAPTPPEVVEGRYIDPQLGIEIELPDGYRYGLGKVGAQLFIGKPGSIGMFDYATLAYTPEHADQLWKNALGGIGESAKAELVPDEAGSRPIDLGWAQGRARGFHLPGSTVEIWDIVVPLCSGRALAGFLVVTGDEDEKDVLAEWVHAVALKTGVAPVCLTLAK